jgi:hypothetical protein
MSRTAAEFFMEALEKTGVKRVRSDSLNGITQLIDLTNVSLASPIGVHRIQIDDVGEDMRPCATGGGSLLVN